MGDYRKTEPIIEGKVKHNPNGWCIFDSNNHHICDPRGWGRFQYMKDGHLLHDQLGDFIQDAINEKMDRMGITNLNEYIK